MPQETNHDQAPVTVDNIGGISHCEVELSPGITILTGRNATNRTSLLAALAGVLGGSTTRLKSDADEGFVKLTSDGQTYTRHYERSDGSVTVDGEPYTDEEGIVNLFSCLLESNPARRAIERGENLREVIMKPVDTEAIQRSIHHLEDERTEINTQIKHIRDERERLPNQKARRDELQEDLANLDERLEEIRTTVDESDTDPEEADATEAALEELDQFRQAVQRQESTVATHRETLETLREERVELNAELEELSERDEERQEVEAELNQLQGRERTLADIINDLSAIVDFNQNLISDEGSEFAEFAADQDITAKLDVMSEEVHCWTCGSTVERRVIDERIEELRDIVDAKRSERQELHDRIETLRDHRSELQEEESRRAELERERREVESDIDRRERQLTEAEETLAEHREQLEAQKEHVEETEQLRNSDLPQHYEELSDLEYERGQLERQLQDVEDEIEHLEGLADEREQLEAQRDEIQTELDAQRTRVEDLEREAIDAFNTRMDEILDLLNYENIERVWIERKEGSKFDSRRGGYRGGSVTKFDLHVVRSTTDGSVYEDTVETLSESEREVIGLVVALAGYLVHRVYETVPMMLLDSLEPIDSERISRLVEYFAEHAEYLVVALLPEDAETLDDEYARVPASALA